MKAYELKNKTVLLEEYYISAAAYKFNPIPLYMDDSEFLIKITSSKDGLYKGKIVESKTNVAVNKDFANLERIEDHIIEKEVNINFNSDVLNQPYINYEEIYKGYRDENGYLKPGVGELEDIHQRQFKLTNKPMGPLTGCLIRVEGRHIHIIQR